MALFGTSNTSQVWRAPRDLPQYGGRPIWISVWSRSTAGSTAGMASFGTDTGGVQSAGPYVASGAVSAWDENDAGTSQIDCFGGAIAASVWQHWLAYYPATNSRAMYLNGVLGASNTTALAGTSQTFNALIVGAVRTTVLTTDRAVGEVVFGNGLLSAGQMSALAAGRNPLAVVPRQILGYYPLRGTLEDLGPARVGLRPIGAPPTVWTEHPKVDLPPRRRLYPATAVSASATPGAGSFTLTGFAPTVSAAASVTPGVGTLALTGFTPSITATATVTPGTASLTLSGLAPSVSVAAAVTPGTGSLTLSGFNPSVSASASVIPGTVALTLVGYAPTLAGFSVSATPGTALLSFIGYAPTVNVDGWFLADGSPTGGGPWSIGDTLTQPLLLNGEPLLINNEPLEIDGGNQDWTRGDSAASAAWTPAP